MANINIKAALTRIGDDLVRVRNYTIQYGHISPAHAGIIDRDATAIAELAAEIAEVARKAAGQRVARGSLLKKVRKALGFTYA
jgi:hypothetical protein